MGVDLAEPTRIIDLHVSDLADHHRFLDVRRHGTPIVVHDPDGLLELRYLHEDLPPAVADRVLALVPGRTGPGSTEQLAELSARCFAWQDELLAPR